MTAQASPTSHGTAKWSPSPDASEIVKGIHAMLHPRNIVLVGATDKPGNYAERIWKVAPVRVQASAAAPVP